MKKTSKEYLVLRHWAEREMAEWTKFIKELKKKYEKDTKRNTKQRTTKRFR